MPKSRFQKPQTPSIPPGINCPAYFRRPCVYIRRFLRTKRQVYISMPNRMNVCMKPDIMVKIFVTQLINLYFADKYLTDNL